MTPIVAAEGVRKQQGYFRNTGAMVTVVLRCSGMTPVISLTGARAACKRRLFRFVLASHHTLSPENRSVPNQSVATWMMLTEKKSKRFDFLRRNDDGCIEMTPIVPAENARKQQGCFRYIAAMVKVDLRISGMTPVISLTGARAACKRRHVRLVLASHHARSPENRSVSNQSVATRMMLTEKKSKRFDFCGGMMPLASE